MIAALLGLLLPIAGVFYALGLFHGARDAHDEQANTPVSFADVLAEGRVNQAATAELDEWLATHPQAAAEPVTCQYCTPLNGVTHLCHKGRAEEDTAAAAGMREFRDRMVQS